MSPVAPKGVRTMSQELVPAQATNPAEKTRTGRREAGPKLQVEAERVSFLSNAPAVATASVLPTNATYGIFPLLISVSSQLWLSGRCDVLLRVAVTLSKPFADSGLGKTSNGKEGAAAGLASPKTSKPSLAPSCRPSSSFEPQYWHSSWGCSSLGCC